MTLSIRAKLTLWYSGLLAAALLVFSATVYIIMASALLTNLDHSLQDRARQAGAEIREVGGRLVARRPDEGRRNDPDEPPIPIALLSGDGNVVGGTVSPAIARWLRVHRPPAGAGEHFYSERTVRFVLAPIYRGGSRAGYVLAWESSRSVDDARRTLLLVMLAAGPALLLVAGIGGWTLAARALAPVTGMTHTAAAISAGDLRRRVPVGTVRDELSELGRTFNAMIDRLEAAVVRERRFTADASHELRSPLSVIRAEATLALERPRSAETYGEALRVIDAQAEGMEELISALMVLARAETALPAERNRIRLIDLVNQAIAQLRATLERQGVRVECRIPDDLTVEGSAPLLTRAVHTVLDNAIKFSPSGGTVHIDVAAGGGAWRIDATSGEGAVRSGAAGGGGAVRTDVAGGPGVTLRICDEGPGIAPEHQERIFEPFYQIAEARTPGESHGLGLAICRSIVAAHGGSVAVRSAPGEGTCFEITFPGGGTYIT